MCFYSNSVNHFLCERTTSNSYRIPNGREFQTPEDIIEHHSKYLAGAPTLMVIKITINLCTSNRTQVQDYGRIVRVGQAKFTIYTVLVCLKVVYIC